MNRGQVRLLLSVVSCALALLIPSPSFAQFYVGVYGGSPIVHDANTEAGSRLLQVIGNEAKEDGVNITALEVDVSDTEFDAGWLLGGRVGYWLESLPFLALEAEFYGSLFEISEQNTSFRTSIAAAGVSGSTTPTVPLQGADMEVFTLGLNILARYPFSSIQPYGGVGVGLVRGTIDDVRVLRDVTFTVDGTSFTLDAGDKIYDLKGEEEWVWGLQVMGGLRGFITNKIALFVEYKYLNTKFEFQPIKIDYDVSHVMGGVEFFFGPGILE